ncbi:hypothetical protein UFOVP1122_33 [uncultured Caudovirales phage]|uniref:Uncharacterized protein n=1 Tax=uncultured Caudovirales phage TaxID=2100421 RepID=A0A6J5QV30_9CAUD|nr:hypothetical protein UFOVP1122_33 [uncultured Caudovirales phage]
MSPRIRRARMAHEIKQRQTALNIAGLAWAVLLVCWLRGAPDIVRALWGLTR